VTIVFATIMPTIAYTILMIYTPTSADR